MLEWKIAAYFDYKYLEDTFERIRKKIQWKFHSLIIKFFLSKKSSINKLFDTERWIRMYPTHKPMSWICAQSIYWRLLQLTHRMKCIGESAALDASHTYVALLMHIIPIGICWTKKNQEKIRRLLLHSIKAKESSRCAGVQQRKEEEVRFLKRIIFW